MDERQRAAELQERLGIQVQSSGKGYAIVDYHALEKLVPRAETEALPLALVKAKRYRRITGADSRTEITLVFQERDYKPIHEMLKAQADKFDIRANKLDEYGNSLPEGVTTEAFAEASNLRYAARALRGVQ